jgi:hypothetical protein
VLSPITDLSLHPGLFEVEADELGELLFVLDHED